jgi:TrkA domain protein
VGDAVEIHETPLPGVGIRYDFSTEEGRQMGLITHHSGRRHLVVYDGDDPDAAREVIRLTESEADAVAELLGAARITGPLNDLQQSVDGLAIDWLRIEAGSRYVGLPLGDTQARTKTGASIVAVIRSDSSFPSPGPSFVFEAGDTIVVVGTQHGIEALREILAS